MKSWFNTKNKALLPQQQGFLPVFTGFMNRTRQAAT
jgi:hypothetical protein